MATKQRTPDGTTSLHNLVMKTFANGISAPYDKTLVFAALALSGIGYHKAAFARQLAAKMLSEMSPIELAAIRAEYVIPGPVLELMDGSPEWPVVEAVDDAIATLTPEQEEDYRNAMAARANSYVEMAVRKVITAGDRKMRTYLDKEAEAKTLLAASDPASEDPNNYPYLSAEIPTNGADLVTVAGLIMAKSDAYRTANAYLEGLLQAMLKGIDEDDVDTLAASMTTFETAIDTVIAAI